jgi:hypothetical protein
MRHREKTRESSEAGRARPHVPVRHETARSTGVPSNPIVGLQQSAGNQATLGLLASGAIQAKLRLSQPGDADEREADRVADRVVSSPEQPAIHRKCKCEGGGASCPACEEEEVEQAKGIHRKASNSPNGDHSVDGEVLQSIGPGQPLDPSTRGFMESRFGRDFGGVRVHSGNEASLSAQTIRARAFTAGSHVVFDKDEYRPHTNPGRRLLAHELAHVDQQSRTGQSNVVHRAPPQQEMPDYIKKADPDTFTVVKTKRLNAEGPFTKEVLYEISTTWTKLAAAGGPGVAQQAVDLLEASDSFVEVANELDKFHLKRGSPRFSITWGARGTKFAPAGTAVQGWPDHPVSVFPEENMIIIDYKSSIDLYTSHPRAIVQFASTIIHESRHAYDYIKKITRGGLKGHLDEEQRTRRAEIKGLAEIKSGTSDKDVQSEIDTRIGGIKQGGLTNREIAEDLVSGGEGTYLETFFLESAINDLLSRKTGLEARLHEANSPIPGALAPIEAIAPADLEKYERSAADITVRYKLDPYLEKSSVPPGHTPSQKESDFLMKFQSQSLTLKQITDFKPPRLSDDYRYVFLYLALVKTYRIKAKLAQAWQDFENDPDPKKKKADVIKKNAGELLGDPRAYSGIKG